MQNNVKVEPLKDLEYDEMISICQNLQKEKIKGELYANIQDYDFLEGIKRKTFRANSKDFYESIFQAQQSQHIKGNPNSKTQIYSGKTKFGDKEYIYKFFQYEQNPQKSFEEEKKSLILRHARETKAMQYKHFYILDVHASFIVMDGSKVQHLVVLEEKCKYNLASYFLKKVEIKEKDIVYLLLQITNGFAFLESENVSQRDIKFENIYVQNLDEQEIFPIIQIADFDHTDSFDILKETECIILPYSDFYAPETLKKFQANQSKFKQKTEIWYFGILVCKMVNNIKKFVQDEQEINDFCYQDKQKAKQEFINQVEEQIPFFGRFIEQCLQLECEQRPTFEELFYQIFDYTVKNEFDFSRKLTLGIYNQELDNQIQAICANREKESYNRKINKINTDKYKLQQENYYNKVNYDSSKIVIQQKQQKTEFAKIINQQKQQKRFTFAEIVLELDEQISWKFNIFLLIFWVLLFSLLKFHFNHSDL